MESKISILITGDFYAGNRIDDLIVHEKYNDIYNDFLPFIRSSDIAVTNLESPLTDYNKPIPKTGPAIKASKKTMEALKYAGFNLLTLANNHIMDFGRQGLVDTLELCEKNKIDYVGAGMNQKEASEVFYQEIKGKKLAFINIAENEWSTTQGNEPGANPLNPVANFYSIMEAKGNADFVFVIVHGGHEMYNLPSPRMKETYRFFVDAGASAVIGHHTHCFSGYEVYNGSPIFYSLGNFLFDWPGKQNSIWNTGYAVKFSITAVDLSYDLIPYEQCAEKVGVNLMDSKSEEEFQTKLNNLNKIILDDDELNRKFEAWCVQESKSYNAFLEPHSNRYLHALQNKGILPSLLKNRKRLLYSNLIRCEAHRDVVLKVLSH
jgi:poly-gamma-glutamate synthesis protein (capsule biosynthesis protein)